MGFRFHTRLGRGVGVSLGRGGARLYAGGRRGFVSVGISGGRATARNPSQSVGFCTRPARLFPNPRGRRVAPSGEQDPGRSHAGPAKSVTLAGAPPSMCNRACPK